MLVLEISNQSQLAPVSDYEVKVWVGNRLVAQGTVTGHARVDGWRKLVSRIVNGSQVKDSPEAINWLDRLRNAAR